MDPRNNIYNVVKPNYHGYLAPLQMKMTSLMFMPQLHTDYDKRKRDKE